MPCRLLYFIISTCAFMSASFALDNAHAIQQQGWNWVGTFSAGPIWESAGQTQTFYLTPDIEKTYVVNQSSRALFNGDLFLGIQKTLTQPLTGQLGLALGFKNNSNITGTIWDDADPQFNNYSYNYKLLNTRVIVKGKLLLDNSSWAIPWVSLGLGVGFNRSHSFTNTPLILTALPNNNFADYTQTSFTYTLGAGIQKILTRNWQVGVGYDFADWGPSHLGRSAGQTLNSGLALNNLYTNGILFNLTYIA